MKKKVTAGISFQNEEFLSKTQERAKELNLSLSAYIRILVSNDLNAEESRNLTIKEDKAKYRKKKDEQ